MRGKNKEEAGGIQNVERENKGRYRKIDGGREGEGKGGVLLRGREQRRQLGDKVGEDVEEAKRRREREHTLITVLHHQANTRTFC